VKKLPGLAIFLAVIAVAAGAQQSPQPPLDDPTFTVPGVTEGQALKIVEYGDTRFTDVSNDADTNPKVR